MLSQLKSTSSTYGVAPNTFYSTPILSAMNICHQSSNDSTTQAPIQHPASIESPSSLWNEDVTSSFGNPQGVISTADDSSSSVDEEFARICANYLNMLSHDELDTAEGCDPLATVAPQADAPGPKDHAPVPDIDQVFDAVSPCPPLEILSLTPFDSPPEDLLVTPALDFEDATPTVASSSPVASVFEDMYRHFASLSHPKDGSGSPSLDRVLVSSPESSTSTLQSESSESNRPAFTAQFKAQYHSTPNGTRPGITPDRLVSIDAPTKLRRYSGPSCTAKKVMPKYFEKRKRSRSLEEDAPVQEEEPDVKRSKISASANPSDATLIEAKRRQNTEAARRSRRRKLEYQQGLEARIDALEADLHSWQTRALMAEAVLKHYELPVPSWPIN